MSNSSGTFNVASGSFALYSNTTANYDTAFGALALEDNTTGTHNTGAGYAALGFNVTGNNNTAMRYERCSPTKPVATVTFLRAAWFMDNAAWDIASARNGLIQTHLQPLDRAVPMVATDDVGRAAAMLLQEGWEGKRIVELEGAQRVSPNELAAAFAKVLGTPVRAEVVPRDRWKSVSRPGHEKSRATHADARWIQRWLDRFSGSRRIRPHGFHRN